MRPTFDERDAAILAALVQVWRAIAGPRVGDFVQLADGTLRRFTHDWGDELQTTCHPEGPFGGDGSFYFGGEYMSFSGSLDPAIPKAALHDTGAEREGRAWFFHHGQVGAHRGVHFAVPCRVYRMGAAS